MGWFDDLVDAVGSVAKVVSNPFGTAAEGLFGDVVGSFEHWATDPSSAVVDTARAAFGSTGASVAHVAFDPRSAGNELAGFGWSPIVSVAVDPVRAGFNLGLVPIGLITVLKLFGR